MNFLGYLIDTFGAYDSAFYMAGGITVVAGLANIVPCREITAGKSHGPNPKKLYQMKSAEEPMIQSDDDNQGTENI